MNTLDYIKFVVKNKYEGKKLTVFEQDIYDIYNNNVYNAFLYHNMTFVIDMNEIIKQVNKLLENKIIITLVFSTHYVYIEKDILTKSTYFKDILDDIENNNTLKLIGILDNEQYMNIVIHYLKFDNLYDYHDLLHHDLTVFSNVVEVFDYLNCSLALIFHVFMSSLDSHYKQGVTLECLNYIYNLVDKNGYSDKMAYYLFKDNVDKLIEDNGKDVVLSSFYFQKYVSNYYGAYTYIVENDCYDYFDIFCDKNNYERLLDILIKDKPTNWINIIKKIYDKMSKHAMYINRWLDRNKHHFDLKTYHYIKYNVDIV